MIGPLPSFDVALVLRVEGGVLYSHGDVDRVFPLASVTKPIVAWSALVAVERGLIGLDDPAGPEGATIRHLLAHASGLPFEGRRPVAAPGKRRIYSNEGFDVLGEVLAGATGMGVAQWVRRSVFEPLGMTTADIPGSPAHAGVASAGAPDPGERSAGCSRRAFPVSCPRGRRSWLRALRSVPVGLGIGDSRGEVAALDRSRCLGANDRAFRTVRVFCVGGPGPRRECGLRRRATFRPVASRQLGQPQRLSVGFCARTSLSVVVTRVSGSYSGGFQHHGPDPSLHARVCSGLVASLS